MFTVGFTGGESLVNILSGSLPKSPENVIPENVHFLLIFIEIFIFPYHIFWSYSFIEGVFFINFVNEYFPLNLKNCFQYLKHLIIIGKKFRKSKSSGAFAFRSLLL